VARSRKRRIGRKVARCSVVFAWSGFGGWFAGIVIALVAFGRTSTARSSRFLDRRARPESPHAWVERAGGTIGLSWRW
jgi:hypothetical protein